MSGSLNLEGLRIGMSNFSLKGKKTYEDFMIHILNNLPKKYDVILDGLENHLTMSGDDTLTIVVICKKLNHWYKKLKNKMKKKDKKKRP